MPGESTAGGIRLDLIRSVQAGDRAAFEDLVLGCRRRVMGTIGRLIARTEDVEDVAQEVFLRMHTSIGRLQAEAAFDLWLYRLTMHATYDYLRKRPRQRRELRMSDLPEGAGDWAARRSVREDQDRRRTIEFVDSLMEQLSPADRILILMREVEGLTMQELAGVFGISTAAAKLRLFRARARLRWVLRPDTPRPRSPAARTALAAQVS